MSSSVFLYKDNEGDRDSVKYFDLDSYKRGFIRLTGANFGTSFSSESNYFNFEENFDCLTTILTREEFYRLIAYNESKDNISDIVNKLLSEENEALFQKVIEEEKEWVKSEYRLPDEDVDFIFDNYGQEYRDRGIVRDVHYSYEDIGERYFDEVESSNVEHLRNYIDFEKYGEDIAEDGYEVLPCGSIVEYAY